MFKRAKVGDRVYCLNHGYGRIRSVDAEEDYPIHVTFDTGKTDCYTETGGVYTHSLQPSLYWDKPFLCTPKPPKRKYWIAGYYVRNGDVVMYGKGCKPTLFPSEDAAKEHQRNYPLLKPAFAVEIEV